MVLIGPQRISATDEAGRRRLDDANYFIRLEVETALGRNIPVVPVLLDGAAMPSTADLPPSLQSLARRNAIQIRHEQFGTDVDRLMAGTMLNPATFLNAPTPPTAPAAPTPPAAPTQVQTVVAPASKARALFRDFGYSVLVFGAGIVGFIIGLKGSLRAWG